MKRRGGNSTINVKLHGGALLRAALGIAVLASRLASLADSSILLPSAVLLTTIVAD